MAITTQYPAEITGFSLKISQTHSVIHLMGESAREGMKVKQERIAEVHFSSEAMRSDQKSAFVNRGGYLNVSYGLSMLAVILSILNNQEDVLIHESGEFSIHKTIK